MKDVSTGKILLLVGFISAVVLTLAIPWRDLNHSFFVQWLFNDASEFARTGSISSHFMPVGYSGFLGTCMKMGGEESIPACQAFVYAGVLFAAFAFLWLRGIRAMALALGTLAVALHPMLLLNIWRIHDGNLTVLVLFGFLASSLLSFRSKSIWSTLLLGISTGLMLTVRMNTVILILPALALLYAKEETLGRYAKKGGLFLVGAALMFMAVNMATKQTPLFFPGHGFYNLFSGTNEYSAKYLLKDFSGENSHKEALEAKGFSSIQSFEDLANFPSETYRELSLNFIKEHPVEYLKLTGIKAVTFFRPGYHVPENFHWMSAEGLKRVSKIVLAAPFFIWVFFVWKTRRAFFEKENFFIFLVIILYLAPFLIANADPRYRFPLDILFIADSLCRAYERIKP